MSHLFVELYEQVGDRFPCCTLADHDLHSRQYFFDLHPRGVADRAARVVVRPGPEYRTGDHIRLLDRARPSDTAAVAVDPAVAADVDLNSVLFDHHGFAGRAEAVVVVTNPNPDSSYRLRMSLYDQVGQLWPSLIFYDWEYPADEPIADLSQFHFEQKAAFIRVEAGPAYQPGDRVILRESRGTDTPSQALEPGDYDLTEWLLPVAEVSPWQPHNPRQSWAEMVVAVELDLQPRLLRH